MLGSSLQLLLSLTSMVSGICAPQTETCKAHPGTTSWPSAHIWATLNRTLNGRLLQPLPPGAVCHPGQPTYNTSQCSKVADEWKTYEFHAGNPISVMWDIFDNYTCLPEEDTPCTSAGYPAYVVNASNAEHVKTGIDFGDLDSSLLKWNGRVQCLTVHFSSQVQRSSQCQEYWSRLFGPLQLSRLPLYMDSPSQQYHIQPRPTQVTWLWEDPSWQLYYCWWWI